MEPIKSSSVTILPETTPDPISLIGRSAGVRENGDTPVMNYERGLSCIQSGHWRALEYVNVEFVLDGYSARFIHEFYTHIGGAPTRLQSSTMCIDYGEFGYVTPPSIKGDIRRETAYNAVMLAISDGYKKLQEMDVPKEDIALILPLGMTTRVVVKTNVRMLIYMSRQSMYSRAYHDEHRRLFSDLATALSSVSDEWKKLVDMTFMPKWEVTGYCPEKNSCSRSRAEKQNRETKK